MLPTPIRARHRPERHKRRGMLPGKPHPLRRHAVAHGHDILVPLDQPGLEIAVAPVAREPVARPVRREARRGLALGASLVVGREAGVVGLEVGVEEGVLFFLGGEGAQGGGEVLGLVAVRVEEQRRVGGGAEGAQLDDLGEPAVRVGVLCVCRGEPLAEALDYAASVGGRGDPEGGGEGDVDLGKG